MKKAVALVSVSIMMLLALVACGSTKPDPIIGNWEAAKISSEGVEIDIKEMGLEGILNISFTKDGYTITSTQDETLQESGAWSVKNGTYTLTTTDGPVEATLDKDVLTMSLDVEGTNIKFILNRAA